MLKLLKFRNMTGSVYDSLQQPSDDRLQYSLLCCNPTDSRDIFKPESDHNIIRTARLQPKPAHAPRTETQHVLKKPILGSGGSWLADDIMYGSRCHPFPVLGPRCKYTVYANMRTARRTITTWNIEFITPPLPAPPSHPLSTRLHRVCRLN